MFKRIFLLSNTGMPRGATGTGEEMADVRWLMAYIVIG